jgi:hypothetical protein
LLLASRAKATVEGYVEGVQGCLPPIGAPLSALAARVQAHEREVKALEGGLLVDKQAALKCLYPVTRSLDPTGTGRARWATRWKPALNAFSVTFGDRFPAAETY